jgi:ABC-type polysaccharide/polyol phosphate transport system ATPase subunit
MRKERPCQKKAALFGRKAGMKLRDGLVNLGKENKNKTIYLISGPCGVGKSTVSKILTQMIKPSAMIVGDYIIFMFGDGSEPPWEERLHLTWKNILALTRNFIQHDFNVIIDFVVEDELEWFCNQISDLDVRLKFIVLRANKETLIERLGKRGDTDLVDRSLYLLNQMESTTDKQFMYDTTAIQPKEIAAEIIANSNFYV